MKLYSSSFSSLFLPNQFLFEWNVCLFISQWTAQHSIFTVNGRITFSLEKKFHFNWNMNVCDDAAALLPTRPTRSRRRCGWWNQSIGKFHVPSASSPSNLLQKNSSIERRNGILKRSAGRLEGRRGVWRTADCMHLTMDNRINCWRDVFLKYFDGFLFYFISTLSNPESCITWAHTMANNNDCKGTMMWMETLNSSEFIRWLL